MMPNASNIARAIEALEAERAHLTARIAKVDEAIRDLRELFHLPAIRDGRTSGRRARGAAAANGKHGNGNGHQALSADAIRAALREGPLSPGALSQALGVERARLRLAIKQLEQERVVVTSGTTVSRQIALAGKPAKEGL